MIVEFIPETGCQIAQGKADRDGYVYAGSSRAHIVAWVRVHGPVPEGKELDHVCRERRCCAEYHLEPVDRRENERRKFWRHRIRIERCPNGHSLADVAIVTANGGRVCRTCRNAALKEQEGL